MAAVSYQIGKTWGASARYTATAVVDVLISNPMGCGVVGFAITSDDTAPTISPMHAAPIRPLSSVPIVLGAGDRLWLASLSQVDGMTATVQV